MKDGFPGLSYPKPHTLLVEADERDSSKTNPTSCSTTAAAETTTASSIFATNTLEGGRRYDCDLCLARVLINPAKVWLVL